MNCKRIMIGNIPAMLYGEPSERLYIFIHGKYGNKEEAARFAGCACPSSYSVLSFDLPEHGERANGGKRFLPWEVVPELKEVFACVAQYHTHIRVRANSIGAWFAMLAFPELPVEKYLLVSPLLDMEGLIRGRMRTLGVTEDALCAAGMVPVPGDDPLTWEYFEYAAAHPVSLNGRPAAVLFAERDEITPRETATAFAKQNPGCKMTFTPHGEHWFHTEKQLEILRRFEESNL